MEHLFLHQKEGIKFLLDNDRALLADEAGLGKTRQLLEAAKHRIGRRDLLVVCPTSIVENWLSQAEKWEFPLDRLTVIGYEYGFLHKHRELLLKRWGVIIADEAHFLKNWTAQRTKKFKDLLKGRDSCVWMVTGTPIVSGAKDLHPMLSFLQPGKWGKYKDFCEMYCQKKINQWVPGGYEYYGMKNEKQLSAAMKDIMIRRYKSEVLEDLPHKITSKIPIQLGSGVFDIFTGTGIMKKVLQNIEQGGQMVLPDDIIETLREMGMKKVEPVVKFIKDTLLSEPLVVFAHHRTVLYDIAERLREDGKRVEVIIGGMDKKAKWAYINAFQAGKIDVLVCGISAAGIGIDLYRASRCVFAEFPWTWAALDQASDRLHRIGQKDCVNVYWCYARGTFEDKMLTAIEARKFMTKELVGLK